MAIMAMVKLFHEQVSVATSSGFEKETKV